MRGPAGTFETPAQLLILLIAFGMPLALGGVTTPVVLAFGWLVLVLILFWIVRAVWVPPAYFQIPAPTLSGPGRVLRLFGHPLAQTHLGIPVVLFIALVLLQLVPLPASVIRLLSPATAGLYETSLPGYGTGEGVDFSLAGSLLLGEEGDGTADRILSGPEDLSAGLSAERTGLRPLSVYPYGTVRQLFTFLALLGLLLVTVNAFRTRRRIEQGLRAIAFFGFGYALFGIVQRLSWNGKIFWIFEVNPEASPFGSFINHNHFAALIVMIVPIAAGMLMDETRHLMPGRPRRDQGGQGSFFTDRGPEPLARLLLAAFVIGVMVGAVVLSASRGAALALAGAFVFYGGALIAQGRVRRAEMMVGVGLLVVAALLSLWLGIDPLAEKIYAMGSLETEPSLLSRVVGWEWTVRIIGDHPLLGTGFGTFAQSWARYYPPGTAAIWHEVHNDYLQLLSETGVVGFVIFAAGFGIFCWKHLLPGVLRSRGTDPFVIHGVALGIVATALHSVVDFPLQINGCAVMFVTLCGLLIAYRLRAGDPGEDAAP